MPWYEPSSSAPRYSGSRNSADGEEWSNGHQTNATRNNNEQIISLQDYLDVNWHDDDNNENTNNGYDNNYSSVQQQSRITVDSFQHRVEHQLGAAVFPSVAPSSFAALNSSLFQTHFNHNHHHHHHHHHDSSSHNINGDDNRTATSFSKTAQFFHPRKVMALRQYEGFFSPLDSNFNNCSGAADSSQEANQQQSDECSNQHDDRLAMNAASDKQQHNIQIQPRNLFVSSQTSNNSINDHHDNYSAAAALPIIGNGNYNSSSFHNSNNYKRKDKLPFVQATLRQDPTTGQLATSLQHGANKERNTNNEGRSTVSSLLGGKATSWENYGGRPLMDGDNNNVHGQSLLRESGKEHNEKKNKKKAKSKRKDNSKGKDGGDGGERNEKCIDSIFQRQMGADENDGNADDGGEGGNSKKKKSKKTKQKRSFIAASSCELTIPTDQGDNSNIMTNSTLSIKSAQPTLSEQDFEGMTNTMNAAQCMEGLQQFLSRVGQEPYVAWTMIFLDPLCHYRQYATDSSSSTNNNNSKRRKKSKKFSLNSDTTATSLLECTTPFLPSNKRYCTDKGPTCTAWNCTCDDQIRAIRGGAPLLGAMFVLNKSDEEGGGEDDGGATAAAAEGGRRGKECYLLPLGPTEKCLDDLEAGYSRMKSWPIIPFDCEVSLSDRWR
eukprot:scaffold20014_cov126-Skeletonema_marinoi.AAC.1